MNAILKLTRRILGRAPPPVTVGTHAKHEFVGHQDDVSSLIFLHDSVHIVTSSEDSTICKWDCETGLLVGESWKVDNTVRALALSPDGKTIVGGRYDGSVQRWDMNGKMMEGIWRGHSEWVRSLSWSPSGHLLASGSEDGTILIRQAESGEVQVGPIRANQGWVYSVAYSPLGDRIASGGGVDISIWDSHTGKLLVGPIQDRYVYSVAWSLDGRKLYSAGSFARVFDSMSGTELHRFQHDNTLRSIALSPKHNLLAGVGFNGLAQLWDTESYQPCGLPFHTKGHDYLLYVSFSPDGRYLAYGGEGGNIMLRVVEVSAPRVPAVLVSSTVHQDGTLPPRLAGAIPEPESTSSHIDHDANATNLLAQSAVNNNEGHDDPYNTFFTPSHSFLHSPLPKPPSVYRARAALSLISQSRRLARRLFSRRLSISTLRGTPACNDQIELTAKGKLKAENRDDANRPGNVAPGATECGSDSGKERQEPTVHKQTYTPNNLLSPAELDSGENHTLFKSLLRTRKMDGRKSPAKVTQDTSPKVVEVSAVRGFKRIVVHKQKRKTKLLAPTPSNSTAPGGLSQAGPSSQPMLVSRNGTDCTDDDSYSDSSIHGPWLKCLNKICYPCGRYSNEDT